MEQTVEEGTCGDYDTFGMEGDAPYRVYTDDFVVLYKQFVNGVLPNVEIGDVVKYLAPSPDKLLAVALGTGTPHGGTLRAIEHAELNGRAVSDDSRVSTECVNLSHYLPFGNTTDGGVATHLPNLVHVHRDEASLRTHIGRCCCRFASRVSGTNHNDVVEKFHCTYYLFKEQSYAFINNIYWQSFKIFKFYCQILAIFTPLGSDERKETILRGLFLM
jgi:hypothetical protein